ncbi:MAG: DUF4445 domain-containing protein [Firmicutes bacterium]|nr:DUF4445 domain-containing protein [Bacillota bacterium]
MITLTIHQKDQTIRAEAAPGELVIDILQREEIPVRTPCGGRGTCGKCRITMTQRNNLTGQMETVSHRACLTQVMEDADVWVPDYSSGYASHHSLSDVHKTGRIYRAAVDIGTTTLAVQVIDPEGVVVHSVTELSDQEIMGADVISRIQAAGEGKRELLTNAVRSQISRMFNGYELQEVVISGNTTMLHLFLGVDPSSLGTYPYTPVFTELKTVTGEEVGLDADTVYILPTVSAFIGADVVCDVLAQDLDKESGIMLIDLGTNGEIVLSLNGRIYAASTAAGPCLEGAEIECGMAGVKGAISHVRLAPQAVGYLRPFVSDSPLQMKIIDADTPEGICGSGLIDVMALLLETGLIDSNGRFVETMPDGPAKRIWPLLRTEDGQKRFYLSDDVYFSEKDIHKFQLAKAAIRSGIDAVLAYAGISIADVDEVLLAGGLGYFLRTEAAIRCGLIPSKPSEALEAVGNTSLEGSLKCMEEEYRLSAQRIARSIEVIDLAQDEGFSKRFIDYLSL